MKRALWTSLVCCLVVLLGSCGGNADDTSTTDQQEVTDDPVASPETPAAGPYCFSFEDETLTLDVALILDEDQGVTGRQVGVIENEAEGYYTSYESSLTGVLEGHTLTLDIVTEIEYDTQEEQAQWTWDGATLNDGLHELTEGACGLSEDNPGDEQHASHCHSEEMSVFSCRLEDSEKVLSLCVSQDFSSDQGYLQYRFGPIGDVELEYPEDQQNTQELFMWQTIGYSGGWDTRVQFSNGGYTYRLYDQAIKVSMSEKELHGGITILDGETVVAQLSCDASTLGPPYSNTLNDLYEKIPSGTFFEEGE